MRTWLSGLMLICTCAVAVDGPFEADEHTVLLMHFDGEARDASDCENHGRPRSELTFTEDGRFGQALLLDGTGGVPVNPSGSLHIGTCSWTWELWVRPIEARRATIIATGWGNNRQLGLRFDGKHVLAWSLSGSASAHLAAEPAEGTFFDDAWHRVALVVDRERGGELRLYVDGQRVGVDRAARIPPIVFESQTMGLCIGAIAPWYIGKPGGFVGAIDEVRLSDIVRPDYAVTDPLPPQPAVGATGVTPFTWDVAASTVPLRLTPQNTVIALNDGVRESTTSKAGAELRSFLRRAHGVTAGFELVDEGKVEDVPGQVVLALGPTRWVDPTEITSLSRDGYIIKRKASTVVICGGKSIGTYYGTMAFLDRFVGIRCYMPTDLWISLPETPEEAGITLGNIDLRIEPFTRSASLSGVQRIPGDKGWMQRIGGQRRLGGTHQHSLWTRFHPKRYAEKCPEIYGVVKGERYIPRKSHDQRWNMCYTNPATVNAAVDSARRHFRQRPQDVYLAYSVMDGHAVCECDTCLAAYKATDSGTDKHARTRGHSLVYWRFMNQLATRLEPLFPDKKLIGLAYASTRFVPPFTLHPNVVVFANFHIAELDADKIISPDATGTSRFEQWLTVCTMFGNHDWYHGNGFLIPRSYTGYWSHFMKALQEKAPAGVFQHCECYPNWGLDGPKYWLMNRLWWEPELDPEMLWQQFCDDMFGPAAAPMRSYWRRWETLWIAMDNVKGPERKLFRWGRQFLADAEDRAVLAACREDLDVAMGTAVTDRQRQRIELFSKTFRLCERLFELARAESLTQDRVDAVREYAVSLVQDPMTLYGAGAKPERALETIDRALTTLSKGKVK
ncbi:MAG: DUF4838 domain-containing protein [Lentisphaerae bacterium]|jgi:hypothetical protein|nr:DUF4838 domain-containing protein [Lentisphaerota bacterium]MBT5611883.1 DUF4838 domain-containing protein [Lentisphaerota bacterium]MBT7054952.1 DUF4838 domain-containing protein [Lentisphaerota bacterium]MBT7845908.1 DUF4838 domain-containing protein [Lentisphaerota bacterium]